MTGTGSWSSLGKGGTASSLRRWLGSGRGRRGSRTPAAPLPPSTSWKVTTTLSHRNSSEPAGDAWLVITKLRGQVKALRGGPSASGWPALAWPLPPSAVRLSPSGPQCPVPSLVRPVGQSPPWRDGLGCAGARQRARPTTSSGGAWKRTQREQQPPIHGARPSRAATRTARPRGSSAWEGRSACGHVRVPPGARCPATPVSWRCACPATRSGQRRADRR